MDSDADWGGAGGALKPSVPGRFLEEVERAIPGRWCARLLGVSMVCDPPSSRQARISPLARSLPEIRLGILVTGRDRLDAEVEEGLPSRAVQRAGPQEIADSPSPWISGSLAPRGCERTGAAEEAKFCLCPGRDVCLVWSLHRGNSGLRTEPRGGKRGWNEYREGRGWKTKRFEPRNQELMEKSSRKTPLTSC